MWYLDNIHDKVPMRIELRVQNLVRLPTKIINNWKLKWESSLGYNIKFLHPCISNEWAHQILWGRVDYERVHLSSGHMNVYIYPLDV